MTKHRVLTLYANGQISRIEAMGRMGFSWYGELLDALAAAHIDKPALPEQELTAMTAHAKKLMDEK